MDKIALDASESKCVSYCIMNTMQKQKAEEYNGLFFSSIYLDRKLACNLKLPFERIIIISYVVLRYRNMFCDKQFYLSLDVFLVESMLNETMKTSSKDHERDNIGIFEQLCKDIGED